MSDAYPDFRYNYQPAHFVLLTVAAETGLLGGFFYAALIVAPWALLWWRRRELTPELIGVSGALLAVTSIGLLRLLHLEPGAGPDLGLAGAGPLGWRPTAAVERRQPMLDLIFVPLLLVYFAILTALFVYGANFLHLTWVALPFAPRRRRRR